MTDSSLAFILNFSTSESKSKANIYWVAMPWEPPPEQSEERAVLLTSDSYQRQR